MFASLSRPWTIPDRLDRMRYLINHLVWQDTLCQPFLGEDWMISTSPEGQRLIALWPDAEAMHACLPDQANLECKLLTMSSIEEALLSELYEDELIAAFPNPAREYEMLTADEFRRAVRYAELARKSHLGTLTDDEREELAKSVRLM